MYENKWWMQGKLNYLIYEHKIDVCILQVFQIELDFGFEDSWIYQDQRTSFVVLHLSESSIEDENNLWRNTFVVLTINKLH